MYKVSRNVRVKDFFDFPSKHRVVGAIYKRMKKDLAHLLDCSIAISLVTWPQYLSQQHYAIPWWTLLSATVCSL